MRLFLLVVASALAIGVGVGAGVWALSSTREDVASNSETSEKAEAAAVRAEQAIEDVQRSRRDQCEEANDRYRSTLREIRRQVAALPRARREEAQMNTRNTRRLIQKLTGGNRDCPAIVGLP